MSHLTLTTLSLIAPTLAGVGLVIALVSGVTSLAELLAAAGAGIVLAIPASWAIARALSGPRA